MKFYYISVWKCWNSAFNAQRCDSNYSNRTGRSHENIHARAEALKKKERQNETQFTTKIDGFLSFNPPWMLMYFFVGFFKISSHVWPNSVLFMYCTHSFLVGKKQFTKVVWRKNVKIYIYICSRFMNACTC